MGFSWDKRPDRLWRQGIDLIGDDGSDYVGEGIGDGAMFGKSEGRELLDVTDNGFDDVAPVKQRLVEERNRQPLHVAAHPRHQGQTTTEQTLREVFADVASVAKQFSDQILGQVRHRRRIVDVTRSQFERDDLPFMVKHQMKFKAEEPTDAGFASCGQISEHLVPVDPPIVAYRKRCAVDVINACPSSHPTEQKDRQRHPHMAGQSDEASIAGRFGKGGAQQSEDDALIERLEVFEMRAVIQHQDGHDLAIGQPRLWPALLATCRPLRQQPSFPAWIKTLAKIIELTKIFHEPVEHARLPTSDRADSIESI